MDADSQLKGLAAAVGCIAIAVEMQEDACPHLDGTLHSLAMLALDEVKAAEKAGEELWQEFRAAKGFPEPEMRRDRTRTG